MIQQGHTTNENRYMRVARIRQVCFSDRARQQDGYRAKGYRFPHSYARLVRGEILGIREREFVQAARALGCKPVRVIARHLLPNLLPPVLIQATFGLAAAIIAEGSLSFLGLGVEPPTPSWGSMLNDGRQFLLVAPNLTTYPGIAIMITVFGLNLVGDGLQDRLQTRRHRPAVTLSSSPQDGK